MEQTDVCNLVEYLAKIQKQNITLALLIKAFIEIIDGCDKLCFTTLLLAETMLLIT